MTLKMSTVWFWLGVIAYVASLWVAVQVGNLTKSTQYWHNSTPDETKQAFEFVVYWLMLILTGKCCLSLAQTTRK